MQTPQATFSRPVLYLLCNAMKIKEFLFNLLKIEIKKKFNEKKACFFFTNKKKKKSGKSKKSKIFEKLLNNG